VSTRTRSTHRLVCDCCHTESWDASTEANARLVATHHGWRRVDTDGRLDDVCPRCAAPEHDRAGCKP
jgi:hypothetical protein